MTACTPGVNGEHPKASGTIVNHSHDPSVYTIHVKFKDSSGNDVGDGVAVVAKVDPGTSAVWHATSTLGAKGPVSCTISSVSRHAVPVP